MSKKNTAVPGRIAGFLGENSYIIVFVAIFIVYALTTNGLTWSGMMNVFRHSAVIGIIGLGMGLICITGEIDLSVGSMLALDGGFSVIIFNMTNSIILTFLFAVLFGAFCGLINGVMVGWIQMPAFIVTLATMLIYRSFAQYFCQHVDKALIGGGSSVYKMANSQSSYQTLYNFGNGKVSTIPIVGLILIIMTLVFVYITTSTKYGKKVYAVGSNMKGAQMAGINTAVVKISVFVIAGALVGIGAFLWIAMNASAVFDGVIEKTKHKPLVKSLDKASGFITKHYKVWLLVFLVMLYPAVYGNNHTQIYYNIDKSLPATLDSNVSNEKLKEDFDMSTVHMILLKNGLDSKEKTQMLDQIDKVDGVKWSLGMNSLIGPTFPESMIPSNIKKMLQSDNYEVQFICSEYSSATDECNAQLDAIQKIVKKYSPESMVIGEAPLMKDLQDTTNVDLQRVNILSMAAIFLIILFVFKSISLPFILLFVIEFAIFVNMAIPYYQGITLPFVASIVIGAIQLGATVDYAILMTSNYQKQRHLGKTKKESISIAHKFSMKSIIVSGCSFFAATFGVALYSKVDMIGAICTLLARGAVISTIVVLLVLPAMFMVFDPLIVHTSKGFLPDKK